MRFERKPGKKNIKINKTKDRLLKAIARYDYLSSFQMDRLLFSNSLTHVQEHAADLFDAEYFQAIPLYKSPRGGSARAIFTLDQRGYDYLKESGVIAAGRFRPTERAQRQPSTLEHTVAANDLLILSHRFSKQHPEFEVERFETEAELKRHPVYLGTSNQRVSVAPDAWVLLVTDEDEYGIAWEVDRGSENRAAFREHIRVRVYYSQAPYRHEFGTDSLTIAYVIHRGGARRLRRVLSLAEDELRELGAQNLASLFKFAVLDPDADELFEDPAKVFLSPIWYQPFSEQQISLLEV